MYMERTAISVEFIEQLAFNTWPAAIQWRYGDWTVRASGPYTKRANSVFAAGEPHSDSWLEDIKAFYSSRQLPALFHISPASPSWLDGKLQASGYSLVTITSLYTADYAAALECSASSGFTAAAAAANTELSESADFAWVKDFLEAEQFSHDRADFYCGLFGRIGPKQSYARIMWNGKCTGIGSVVVERGWAGFTNIAVHPEYRRLGFGRKLIHELIAAAGRLGAEKLYLQVVADNDAAVKLYHSCGFTHQYDYHYRIRNN
jgi:ribosomal protein S18 acetylase RimI-like enzyme